VIKPASQVAIESLNVDTGAASLAAPVGPGDQGMPEMQDSAMPPQPTDPIDGATEVGQVAAGGPLRMFSNLFKPVMKTHSDSRAVTVQEVVPDSVLDDMTDALTDPDYNPYEVSSFNLDNIREDSDLHAAIGKVSELYAERTQHFTRGVVSHERTRELAQQLEADIGDQGIAKMLLERETGQTFAAHEIHAMRNLYVRAATDAVTHARAVVESGGAQDVSRFRHRMALITAMHMQLTGAKSEAGRTLNAFAIAADAVGPVTSASRPRKVSPTLLADQPGGDAAADMLQRTGGLAAAKTAARAVIAAHQQHGNNWGLVSRTVRGVQGKDTVDAVIEGWLGGLVSSPDTWMLAFAGNAAVQMARVNERAVDSAWLTVVNRDFKQMVPLLLDLHGRTTGAMTGLVLAGRTLLRGEHGLDSKFTDGSMEPAIQAKTFANQRVPAFQEYTLGEAYGAAAAKAGRLPGGQLMEPAMLKAAGMLGQVVDFAGEYYFRLGFRVLSAEDQLFRSMTYTGELQAGAYRYALDAAAAGAGDVSTLYRAALDDPERLIPDVHLKSLAQAREDVLQQAGSGGVFAGLQTMTNHPMGRLFMKPIFPFQRVINNTLSWSWDRVPLGPQFMDMWRAHGPDNSWSTLRGLNGEARRAEEIAKMTTGALVLLYGWQTAASGSFSGIPGYSSDPKARSGARLMGLTANSITFEHADGSNTSYDINRMDPIATLFLVSAMTNRVLNSELDDATKFETTLAATMAMRDIMSDKSALASIEDVMKLWGSTEQTFDDRLITYMARQSSGLVPSWAAKIKRETDETPYYEDAKATNPYDTPWLRFVSEVSNRASTRMPQWMSDMLDLNTNENLPVHVNLFGEPWRRPHSFPFDWAGPIATTEPRYTRKELDAALPERYQGRWDLRGLRTNYELTPDEIGTLLDTVGPHGELQRLNMPVDIRQRKWKGIKLSPEQHKYMLVLEGPEIYEALADLMLSDLYREASDEPDVDGGKLEMIADTVRRVRDLADTELMTDPYWADIVDARRLLEQVQTTGELPVNPPVPGAVPGQVISPDDAVTKLLGGKR
tara:strand:- start:5470 stop:8652 length:3183 start_codon:yes stop_codon:yes gene_type:complete